MTFLDRKGEIMNTKKSILMGAALAGLMASCNSSSTQVETNVKASEVMCYGVNSCKGKGACHGKVDACSGKNGCEASATCAGQNSCKGKGFIKLTEADCKSKGGKVAI